MLKRIIASIMCVSVSAASVFISSEQLTVNAETITKYGDFTYEEDSETEGIIITNYSGSDSVVFVPETINGLKVISIGASAFRDNNDITEVILPDSIVSIGSSAFSTCKNLRKINLPESLEVIGSSAFTTCHALEEIEFGSNVKDIQRLAFQLCISVKTLTVPGTVETIVDHAFHGMHGLEVLKFTEGTKTIESGSFTNAYSIKEVHIPKSVETIGVHALCFTVYGSEYTPIGSATIYGYAGTAAQTYSEESGIDFIPYDIGDIDNNGMVDARDASSVLYEYASLSAGSEFSFGNREKCVADIDGDSKISASDASNILKYYAYISAGGDIPAYRYLYE